MIGEKREKLYCSSCKKRIYEDNICAFSIKKIILSASTGYNDGILMALKDSPVLQEKLITCFNCFSEEYSNFIPKEKFLKDNSKYFNKTFKK